MLLNSKCSSMMGLRTFKAMIAMLKFLSCFINFISFTKSDSFMIEATGVSFLEFAAISSEFMKSLRARPAASLGPYS